MCVASAIRSLLLVLIALQAACHSSIQFTDVLQKNFCQTRQSHEYSESVRGEDGVVQLRHTATDGDNSLELLQLTNGSIIVQLVFTQFGSLSDCDISTSKRHIHRLLKHVYSKHNDKSFQTVRHCLVKDNLASQSNEEALYRDMNLKNWIERCNEFHGKLLNLREKETIQVLSETGGLVKVDRSSIETDSVGKKREKRGLFSLIYPGTKWCGKGNSSKNATDFGTHIHTDRCCKAHDNCPDVIPGLSTAYNYFNYGILTISSCKCDDKLRRCLQEASTKNKDQIADMIGHIYFNVIGMDCFNVKRAKICKERSFWGYCSRQETGRRAVLCKTGRYDP